MVVVVMACPVDCRPAAAVVVVVVVVDRSVASFQAMMCQSADDDDDDDDDDDHSRQFLVDPFHPCSYSSVFVVPSFDSVPRRYCP